MSGVRENRKTAKVTDWLLGLRGSTCQRGRSLRSCLACSEYLKSFQSLKNLFPCFLRGYDWVARWSFTQNGRSVGYIMSVPTVAMRAG